MQLKAILSILFADIATAASAASIDDAQFFCTPKLKLFVKVVGRAAYTQNATTIDGLITLAPNVSGGNYTGYYTGDILPFGAAIERVLPTENGTYTEYQNTVLFKVNEKDNALVNIRGTNVYSLGALHGFGVA